MLEVLAIIGVVGGGVALVKKVLSNESQVLVRTPPNELSKRITIILGEVAVNEVIKSVLLTHPNFRNPNFLVEIKETSIEFHRGNLVYLNLSVKVAAVPKKIRVGARIFVNRNNVSFQVESVPVVNQVKLLPGAGEKLVSAVNDRISASLNSSLNQRLTEIKNTAGHQFVLQHMEAQEGVLMFQFS